VPDPAIQEPTDAIVRITTTGLCGSDLHLHEVMGPFLGEGDVLGHEPMGIVEEVGPEVTELRAGDRVVDERLDRARANGVEALDLREREDDLADVIREATGGRGPDSVIEVGMEAHGAPGAKLAQQITGLLPDAVARKMMEKAGLDRLHDFYLAIDPLGTDGFATHKVPLERASDAYAAFQRKDDGAVKILFQP
jgi:threonine dehydrogenase-like Zn-dependent dehydrogenase